MKEQIEEIIKKIENKHLNDPTKSDDMDEIINVLSQNVSETVKTINELSENAIDWISVFFEDISWKFKSPQFIEAIEKLIIKFPDLKQLAAEVERAKEALK